MLDQIHLYANYKINQIAVVSLAFWLPNLRGLIKVDMIIMNKNIESKSFVVINSLKKNEIADFRKDLDNERKKCD